MMSIMPYYCGNVCIYTTRNKKILKWMKIRIGDQINRLKMLLHISPLFNFRFFLYSFLLHLYSMVEEQKKLQIEWFEMLNENNFIAIYIILKLFISFPSLEFYYFLFHSTPSWRKINGLLLFVVIASNKMLDIRKE